MASNSDILSASGSREAGTRFAAIVLSYGALWGLVETTLGFLLHLLPQALPVPHLAGAVMFPIGLLFMMSAYRQTGEKGAMLATAVVAAAVKAASFALPAVLFRFVRNPVLAILSEGLISFVVVGLFGLERDRLLIPKALLMSVAWRVLFLGANLALGIRGGILAKPASAIAGFLVLDSLANGALIALGVELGHRKAVRLRFSPAPLVAVLVLTIAVGGELFFATL